MYSVQSTTVQTPPTTTLRLLLLILVYISLILSASASTSTPSQTSYNVYNYDYTTPMFTPDGLLKQVEYASLASTHSSPLVIVPIITQCTKSNDNGNDSDSGSGQGEAGGTTHLKTGAENKDKGTKCYIIMASTSTPMQPKGQNENNNESSENRNEIKGQSKIIPIPISPSQGKISSSILVGMNGLLPDCMFLLRHARDELHSYHKTYGIHRIHTSRDGIKGFEKQRNGDFLSSSSDSMFASSSSCSYRFATSIAERCQRHSFGGGLRPFGSQIVICGVDRTMMNVFITNPSGAIYHYGYNTCANDNTEDGDGIVVGSHMKNLVQDVVVFGGQERIQRQIKEQIVNQCSGLNCDHQVKDVVKIIYTCLQQNLDEKIAINDSFDDALISQNKVEMVLLGHDNCQSISEEYIQYLLQNKLK